MSRLELADRVADGSQVAGHPHGPDLVPQRAQRGDDVVLGLPVGGLDLGGRGRLGGDERAVHEGQHAKALHRGTR